MVKVNSAFPLLSWWLTSQSFFEVNPHRDRTSSPSLLGQIAWLVPLHTGRHQHPFEVGVARAAGTSPPNPPFVFERVSKKWLVYYPPWSFTQRESEDCPLSLSRWLDPYLYPNCSTGEENEEGRSSRKVWNEIWGFTQKDGEENRNLATREVQLLLLWKGENRQYSWIV